MRVNLIKIFFEVNFPPLRALEFITGHMVYNLAYTNLNHPAENHLNGINDIKGKIGIFQYVMICNIRKHPKYLYSQVPIKRVGQNKQIGWVF